MSPVATDHTLATMLQTRAAAKPDALAFRFVEEGTQVSSSLTFAQLDARARRTAAFLQSSGAANERALLIHSPGLEFLCAFFGCLYAGAIPVPLPPPRTRSDADRLTGVLSSASPKYVLTEAGLMSRLGLTDPAHVSSDLQIVDGAAIDGAKASRWRSPGGVRSPLAYIQYTSGSTSAPKGVMVGHANVLANLAEIDSVFRHDEASVIVSWLPHYHDMGLVYGLMQPIFSAVPCVLMSPFAFAQRPARWLEAISTFRATHSGGPNFGYDLCARRVSAAQRASLDLSTWRVAFNGAERIDWATMREFARMFEPCGFDERAFCPAYGLAEATLKVTACRPGRPLALSAQPRIRDQVGAGGLAEDARSLVGNGAPTSHTEIAIVDPDTSAPCSEGTVGEVWVSGPSVALGYWGRPEETEHTFKARLAGVGNRVYLRTGDLGFLHSEDLFVVGRLKDLIIVRGQNYYPEDLEATVASSHPAIRRGGVTAFAVDRADERLVVMVEGPHKQLSATQDLDSVARAVARAIGDRHALDVEAVAFVPNGKLPRTTSGKLQRAQCRAMYLRGAGPELWIQACSSQDEPTGCSHPVPGGDDGPGKPATPGALAVLAFLAPRLARLLKRESSAIPADATLTSLGLDSLAAAELSSDILEKFGVEVSISELLDRKTFAVLIDDLAVGVRPIAERDTSAPRGDADDCGDKGSALSDAQESQWILCGIDGAASAYNIARAVVLHEAVDLDAVEAGLQALVERHGELRTRFVLADGGPVRITHTAPQFVLGREDATQWTEDTLRDRVAAEARRPFDFAGDLLLRATAFHRAPSIYVFVIVAPHIIADLRSFETLFAELGALYCRQVDGEVHSLPPLTANYGDYVAGQRAEHRSEKGRRALAFWQARLEHVQPLDLPADSPRPPAPRFLGGRRAFQVSAPTSDHLDTVARAHEATPFMVLAAAYVVLLHKRTGQRAICIGAPTMRRPTAALADVVGNFVNPIAIVVNVDPQESFADLLEQVRRVVLDGLAHASCPFRALVEHLGPSRGSGRGLFQAWFAFQEARRLGPEDNGGLALGIDGARVSLGSLNGEVMAIEPGTSQFDLSLSMARTREGLAGTLEYDSDLYRSNTADRIVRHFLQLLDMMAVDPSRPIAELSPLDAHERDLLLRRWNDTRVNYGGPDLLHELVERQMAASPSAVAVRFAQSSLTYGELRARSDAVAQALVGTGVQIDDRIGVCMNRGLDLPTALLGVLKAGAAYVPLDPDYPDSYRRRIIGDAGLSAIIVDTATSHLDGGGCPTIDIDQLSLASGPAVPFRPPKVANANLAYVIYTSGSTGQPKGVMNTHAGICNRLLWMQDAFGLDASDRVLQKTPFTFDVSVWEFFWPLMTGAALVIAEPGGHRDPAYLRDLIDREAITTVHFVPSMLDVFLSQSCQSSCPSLRLVISSGESLPAATMDACRRYFNSQLHNLYGPTEAAVDVTWWRCDEDPHASRIPIGRPIANMQMYVLDDDLMPVPVGVDGSMYIGGPGLARGYVNRPDWTAERFVPNPFGADRGGRLYATGDVGRWREDGALEFLHRADHQVKIRGFRVELDEIADALRRCGARDAAVVAVDGERGMRVLAAHVVSDELEDTLWPRLRRDLAALLPEHMVPSVYVRHAELPRTSTGKLDRKALPSIDLAASRPAGPEEPTSELESVVARVWAETFGTDRVGVGDNFFELGGHSLIAMRIVTRLNERFSTDLPLVLLLSGAPTVRLVARALDEAIATRERPHVVELGR